MVDKKKLKINIMGVDYQIVSDEDPNRLEEIVDFVDEMIMSTKKASPEMTNMSAAVLTALNVSDEVFSLRDKLAEMEEHELRFAELVGYKEKYEKALSLNDENSAKITFLQSRNERLELENQEINVLLDEYKQKFSSLRTEYELNKRTMTDLQNKLMENQIELVKVRKTLLEMDEQK